MKSRIKYAIKSRLDRSQPRRREYPDQPHLGACRLPFSSLEQRAVFTARKKSFESRVDVWNLWILFSAVSTPIAGMKAVLSWKHSRDLEMKHHSADVGNSILFNIIYNKLSRLLVYGVAVGWRHIAPKRRGVTERAVLCSDFRLRRRCCETRNYSS